MNKGRPFVNGQIRPPDGRTLHYAHFYGLSALPPGELAIFTGNCQAESLRIMLDGGGLSTVRMPAVHELQAADIPFLHALLARAAVLVSQPIRDGYHGLPLGTREMSGMLGASSRTVVVPVIRFAGLYPAQAIIRPPGDASLVPPVAHYHDLRTLVEAADRLHGRAARPAPRITEEAVRSVGAQSIVELRTRENKHGAVMASDLFDNPSFAQMRTINHPGNSVWAALATRVRAALSLPAHTVDPGRELLNAVHAPREEVVAAAYGLDDAPTDYWRIGDDTVPAGEVREEHLRWYGEHPEVVDAGLTRHADALRILGLAS
jgi:hypothetical protein